MLIFVISVNSEILAPGYQLAKNNACDAVLRENMILNAQALGAENNI